MMPWTILFMSLAITSGCVSWSVLAQKEYAQRQRFLRFAGVNTTEVEEKTPETRLPRPLTDLLDRAGFDWSLRGAIARLLAAAAIGTFVAEFAGVPWVGPILGFGCLYAYLQWVSERQRLKLSEQLPDVLMLIVSALKAGLGLQQSIQMAATEASTPISRVMGQLSQDLAVGMSLELGLERLKKRIDSADGEMLAAAVLVHRQTGGNLSEILLNLHATIRDRQAIHGQVRALSAQGRLSGYILTGLPFFLAAVIHAVNRTYLDILFVDPRGRIALVISWSLVLIGGFIIRRIVTITL